MLYAVAQLAEYVLWYVCRTLGDKVDADTLGTDESDDLLYLVKQGFRGVLEQHVCLVEEEHQLGLWQVADLGQGRVELTQQPQQECRVELGLQHQLVCSQHVHHPLAVLGLHQVLDVERRQAEELVGTLVLQLQQSTLDGSHGSR